MSQPASIRSSVNRHVGWLEFNRPPVNAFTRGMVDEVHDALARTLADPAVRDTRLDQPEINIAFIPPIATTQALAAIRRTVTLGGGMTFEDGMKYELETVAALAGTPDFAEGVDAFLAKRPPHWRAP
jgi:enoyl-CoA hydratase/carnithine racemase